MAVLIIAPTVHAVPRPRAKGDAHGRLHNFGEYAASDVWPARVRDRAKSIVTSSGVPRLCVYGPARLVRANSHATILMLAMAYASGYSFEDRYDCRQCGRREQLDDSGRYGCCLRGGVFIIPGFGILYSGSAVYLSSHAYMSKCAYSVSASDGEQYGRGHIGSRL